jgi:hypothetical protein
MNETDERDYTVIATDLTTGRENDLFRREFSKKDDAEQYGRSLELQNLKYTIFNCSCDTEQD